MNSDLSEVVFERKISGGQVWRAVEIQSSLNVKPCKSLWIPTCLHLLYVNGLIPACDPVFCITYKNAFCGTVTGSYDFRKNRHEGDIQAYVVPVTCWDSSYASPSGSSIASPWPSMASCPYSSGCRKGEREKWDGKRFTEAEETKHIAYEATSITMCLDSKMFSS